MTARAADPRAAKQSPSQVISTDFHSANLGPCSPTNTGTREDEDVRAERPPELQHAAEPDKLLQTSSNITVHIHNNHPAVKHHESVIQIRSDLKETRRSPAEHSDILSRLTVTFPLPDERAASVLLAQIMSSDLSGRQNNVLL